MLVMSHKSSDVIERHPGWMVARKHELAFAKYTSVRQYQTKLRRRKNASEKRKSVDASFPFGIKNEAQGLLALSIKNKDNRTK